MLFFRLLNRFSFYWTFSIIIITPTAYHIQKSAREEFKATSHTSVHVTEYARASSGKMLKILLSLHDVHQNMRKIKWKQNLFRRAFYALAFKHAQKQFDVKRDWCGAR